ncbi:MAG: hypothetical protein J6K32_01170 [Clostridia bacterium]|nr:hypothetical protein [Clostridia bacterium]
MKSGSETEQMPAGFPARAAALADGMIALGEAGEPELNNWISQSFADGYSLCNSHKLAVYYAKNTEIFFKAYGFLENIKV